MICHENDKPYLYKYVNVLRDNFEFAQKQAKTSKSNALIEMILTEEFWCDNGTWTWCLVSIIYHFVISFYSNFILF